MVEPGGYLHFAVSEACSRLFYCILRLCNETNITGILCAINFNILNCNVYANLRQPVCELIVRTVVYFWTKQINLILTGNNEKFKYVLKNVNHKLIDPIRVEAHNKFLKRNIKGKKN